MAKSSKGSSWEREFSRDLSLWWSGGKASDLFWRSSQSGGRATVRRRKGLSTRGHCGDITATDSVGELLIRYVTIELKRGYSRHTVHDMFDKPANGAKQEWEKWILQAYQAKKNAGTPYWMIVAKRDRREAVVLCPLGLYTDLRMAEVPGRVMMVSKGKRGDGEPVALMLFPLRDLFKADVKKAKKQIRARR